MPRLYLKDLLVAAGSGAESPKLQLCKESIVGPEGTGLYVTSDLLYQDIETKINSKEHPILASINLKRGGKIFICEKLRGRSMATKCSD